MKHTMSLTYREACNLFQYEQPPSSSTQDNSGHQNHVPMTLSDSSIRLSGKPTTNTDQHASSSSNELVLELRRLREHLQRLQLTGALDGPPDALHSMSDRLDLVSADSPTGTTARANSVPRKSDTLRCLESCCNGRAFSSRSNLIRHQRERRGESAKLRCSFCDAVFSRRTARDAHEAARRCRHL
ncbi:hypothetical protein BDV29DRAFT_167401 [Aspergillus leporis]|uniref:C2H2-type domain-containing protein n=1 Tax=Aspergillus leporis TaxID=41062 RepID=A0A5N5XB53_9EURO|nr:hypothetical protein BDV29DRAFT_167401 [Aspergillus leporis]